MPTDLRIVLPNRAGAALKVFEALAAENINIDGVCGDIRPGERWGFIHVLVDSDADRVKAIVEGVGMEVTYVREVEVLEIENRPGTLAELFRDFAAKGTSVDVLYGAFGDKLVLATEDSHPDRPGVKMSDVKFP